MIFFGIVGSIVWDVIICFIGWCDVMDKEGFKVVWVGVKEWFGGVVIIFWDFVMDIDW